MPVTKKRFQQYSFLVLAFALLTIFWGAWVRLSFSGDGCGASWPLCNGHLLPDKGPALIEWIHRLTSLICLVLTLALRAFASKVYRLQNAPAKKSAQAALIFIFIEALIGALLVTSGLVAGDQSNMRVLILSLHLVNSLFLTAALGLCFKTALWPSFKIKKPLIYFALAFIAIALLGNVASLAGQLFPVSSLKEALYLDFLPSSHISLRLRILHPLLAVLFLTAMGAFVFFKGEKLLKILWAGAGAVALAGFLTWALASPLLMKMLHLILAYLLWIGLVFLSVKEGPRLPPLSQKKT